MQVCFYVLVRPEAGRGLCRHTRKAALKGSKWDIVQHLHQAILRWHRLPFSQVGDFCSICSSYSHIFPQNPSIRLLPTVINRWKVSTWCCQVAIKTNNVIVVICCSLQSYEEHGVVWNVGHQGIRFEHLQKPGTADQVGMRRPAHPPTPSTGHRGAEYCVIHGWGQFLGQQICQWGLCLIDSTPGMLDLFRLLRNTTLWQ